jgi:hypothetical protein
MLARMTVGFLALFLLCQQPGNAGAKDDLQKHLNEIACNVKATNDPAEKRAILDDQLRIMTEALDRVKDSPLIPDEDRCGVERYRTILQEKRDELSGLKGYERVSDEHLNAFADYVVQDMGQAIETSNNQRGRVASDHHCDHSDRKMTSRYPAVGMLRCVTCTLMAYLISSCSPGPPSQREAPGEDNSPPRYSMVFIIHGDGEYLYFDTLGNEHIADDEILRKAKVVAESNPAAEVFIFSRKTSSLRLPVLSSSRWRFLVLQEWKTHFQRILLEE